VEIDRLIQEMRQDLEGSGFKSSVVSVRRVEELRLGLEDLRDKGVLNEEFYKERIAAYSFRPPADLPKAKSVILTAVRQPKVVVKFMLSGKVYPAIIPPTYYYDTDKKALDIITSSLSDIDYRVASGAVPAKALAVRCGLAKYGKNNIAYIDGWGSYFRIKAFYTEMPCTKDNWNKPQMLELCEKCVACVKGCPTGAITEDRFVIHAERCLCYLNENPEPFPDWLDPQSHNCLMGCMSCQDVCPVNKEVVGWEVPGREFTEEETQMILKGVPKDKLPDRTVDKLQAIYMFDDYDLIPRNLRALVEKLQKAEAPAAQ
jgi:epoxyqueuosine reductase